MTWIRKIFVGPNGLFQSIKGTIKSNGGMQQGPVSVFTIKSEHDRNEFDEGCKEASEDFKAGRQMQQGLNYPAHPFARGYVGTYSSLVKERIRKGE